MSEPLANLAREFLLDKKLYPMGTSPETARTVKTFACWLATKGVRDALNGLVPPAEGATDALREAVIEFLYASMACESTVAGEFTWLKYDDVSWLRLKAAREKLFAAIDSSGAVRAQSPGEEP